MSDSIRDDLRTFLDSISGMTAPVDVSASPQNRNLPFIQLQVTDTRFITLDGKIEEPFEIRSYGNYAAEAQSNAHKIRAALNAANGATIGSRIADCVFLDSTADQAIPPEAGQEVGSFLTIIKCRIYHRVAA